MSTTEATTSIVKDPFNVMVGAAIRRAREKKGWTQAAVAEAADLSPNYVARLERGELGPSLRVADRICDALGINLEVLVTPVSKRSK